MITTKTLACQDYVARGEIFAILFSHPRRDQAANYKRPEKNLIRTIT